MLPWSCASITELLTLTLPGPSAGVNGSLDSYCSLKPLCSGMAEVVPARTSPTLLPHPLALCCHYPVSKCRSASIAMTGTLRVNLICPACFFISRYLLQWSWTQSAPYLNTCMEPLSDAAAMLCELSQNVNDLICPPCLLYVWRDLFVTLFPSMRLTSKIFTVPSFEHVAKYEWSGLTRILEEIIKCIVMIWTYFADWLQR